MKKNENERKWKKMKKREEEQKKGGKKRKEGQMGTQKMMFYMRTVKRNRNEIETQKKSDFEHPIKKKKMKENERKWK